MRHSVLRYVCFFLPAVLLVVGCPLAGAAAELGVPADYPTISAAVQAAGPGDVIRIAAGEYAENVAIDKDLSIIGHSAATTIIKGTAEYAVTISGRVLLEHLTVTGPETGIQVDKASELTVRNCRIVDCPSDGIGFESSTKTVLRLYDSEILRNGDGIDLEGTQGIIADCELSNNRDDGLDYDGNAGVLTFRNHIANNRDDGIEIRLATTTLAIICRNVIEGNGEDGIEFIDSPRPDPTYNIASISENVIRNCDRFGVGCVDQETEEAAEGQVKATIYWGVNDIVGCAKGAVSPNYVAQGRQDLGLPRAVSVSTGASGAAKRLPLRHALLLGIIDMKPNISGESAGDLEGVAVDAEHIYVADDVQRRIHIVSTKTGRLEGGIPTKPFPDSDLLCDGPEGLSFVGPPDARRLLLADDATGNLFHLSLQRENLGHVESWEAWGEVLRMPEGVEYVDGTLFFAFDGRKLAAADPKTKRLLDGFAPAYVFEGFGRHVAGVGWDGERLLLTAAAYAGEKVHSGRSLVFGADRDTGEVLGIWSVGAFASDPRGIATWGGLAYVVDGMSHYTDAETGWLNAEGEKVFIIWLAEGDPPREVLERLPVR